MSKWVNSYDDEEEKIDTVKQSAFQKRLANEKAAEQKALQAQIQKEIDTNKRPGTKTPPKENPIDKIFNENMEKNVVEITGKKQPKKPKKVKKPRKPRAKKAKKVAKKVGRFTVKSFTIEEIEQRKLNQYPVKIEVNEYNQFKVDYIKRKIHTTKDKKQKAVFIHALTKYDL